MKKRFLIILAAILIPFFAWAQITSTPGFSSVISSFLRSTTASAARTAIGAANSGSGGALTNTTIYGSTSGSVSVNSAANVGINNIAPASLLQIGTNGLGATVRQAITFGNSGFSVPSPPNTITNGDKLVLWNDSFGKSAIVQGIAYDLCFQSGGGSGAGFKWYSGAIAGSSTNEVMRLTAAGLLGLGTTGPGKALEINSATGACLQLTYNDPDGGAVNKAMFDMSAGGNLTIAPSGGTLSVTGNMSASGNVNFINGTLSNGNLDFQSAATIGSQSGGDTRTVSLVSRGQLILNPNGAGTGGAKSIIGIGGVTSSQPGLKASSTTLAVRLADDSGDAPITAAGGTFSGKLSTPATSATLGAAATTLAETSNVLTVTGDAGGNTLATITGGVSGQILTLIFVDSLVTITDDATGNANTVNLSGAFTSTSNDTLTLVFNGTSWREVSRSVN